MGILAPTKVQGVCIIRFCKSEVQQGGQERRRRRRKSATSRRAVGSDLLLLPSPFIMLLLFVALLPENFRAEGAPIRRDTPHVTSRRFRDPKATFYELLGVSKRASQEEIKRVFRRLAVKMHPDKLGPFESEDAEIEANNIFVKILKAYEILGDPDLRQKYDLSGMNEDTGNVPFETEPERRYEDAPFSLFVRFGGGRGGLWFSYKGQGTRRAPDSVVALPLTFEEVFEGKTANITVTRERLCRTCRGTGANEPEKMPKCNLCEGKGYAYHLFGVYESSTHGHKHGHHSHTSTGPPKGRCSAHEDGSNNSGGGSEGAGASPEIPGYAHAVNTTCKVCGGTGKISDGGCPDCRGKRVKVETDTFEVKMPAGALPGHTVHFGGQGTQHPDKLPGSIRVVAAQLAHPRFERQGADLVYKKKISLLDALQGFERMLTLLDGSRVRIVHDEITLSGYRQELPNLGFPVVGTDNGDGDGERGGLIVDFEVEFPVELREDHLVALRAVLTEEEISVLEDVLKLMSARKAESWRPEMDPLEYRYTRFCSREDRFGEHANVGGADGGSRNRSDSTRGIHTRCCIPDVLWWARPWVSDFLDLDHSADTDFVDDDERSGGADGGADYYESL